MSTTDELEGTTISHGMSIISDEGIFIFTWVVYGSVCQLINIFGIVTNIVNIICFIKQGFKDSVNISLMGLSISDLGCLITLTMTNICFTPAVSTADLNFDPIEVNYLTMAMPHLSFSRVTSWITALITMERCLCVTAPLKVARIMTPERTIVTTVSIFLIFFCSAAPVYVVNRLGMKFSPIRNKTIFGLVFMADRERIEKISFAINNFVMPFAAFFVIVICTITLVIKLKSSTDWINKSTTQSQADRLSNRNKKAAKMVVMISTLFIICFVPLSISMLALAFEPELSFSGRYIKIGIMLGGLGFILESVNSSVNIFIYYQMSSKYRKTLRRMCYNSGKDILV